MKNFYFALRMMVFNLLFVSVLTVIPEIVMAQPTEGATNFNVNNIEGDRFRVSWTRGDGERRIVVASENQNFGGLGVPVDGTDYNANNTFGTGDQIGTGNFVVYRGTGTNFTTTGLDSTSTYYFRVYEFDGQNFETVYNTTDVLTGSGTTLSSPSTGVSNLNMDSITGNDAFLSWERGDGDRNLMILREGSIPGEPELFQNYWPSQIFGSGSAVGGGRAIIAGTQNSAHIRSLQPDTWYYTALYEYNGNSYPVYSYGTALVDSFLTGKAPLLGSEDFRITNTQGDRLGIRVDAGSGSRRLIVARQDEPVDWIPEDGLYYNDHSSFGQGDNLGNNTFVVANITGSTRTVQGLTPSTVYHFAVFEFNGTGNNTWYLTDSEHVLVGQGETLSAPTTQGGNFVFSEIDGNSARVDFDPGNGDGRIVLARAGAAVEDIPVNLETYFPNSNFNNAGSIGDSKIVFRGSGNGFNFTGLQPEVEYHFAVFEYNGGSGPVYNQNNPGRDSFTTLGAPTVPTSNLTYSNIQGDRIRLNFERGDGAGRIVIARQGAPVNAFPETGQSYGAGTTFGNGHELGSGNFVITNTTSANVTVTGLVPETTYHFAIIEYNGSGDNRFYMVPDSALTGNQPTLFPPDQQATVLNFSDITPNSVRINWTEGSGDSRLVLVRPEQAVETMPENLSSYWPNSNYINSATLADARIVYRGNGNSVEVTNIPPGIYHVAVIEFNGSTGPVYRTNDPLMDTVAVGGPPETPATNLSFSNVQGDRFRTSFTRGDGTRRLIVMREEAPVNAWPQDGNSFSASGTFGSGAEIGNGNFVVYSGTGAAGTTSGLKPETTYHVAIVEYNGTGSSSFYQDPEIVAVGSYTTLSAPEVPTSNIFANNVTGNRMQLTWTRGSGDGRLVVGRLNESVSQYPDDLSSPYSHGNFGNGTHLGDQNYVLYAGTGDNFTVSGLEPDTTYHFAFLEYNGSSGRVYLRDPIARVAYKTAERPFVRASDLSVSNRNGDRLRVNFSQGNGARRLVVFKKDAPVDALPEDLVTYATAAFGSGAELGNGNFAVGIANGSFVNVTGLEPDARYGVAVFELDGSNGNERYMVNEFLAGFVRTSSPPQTPPTGLIVNNVGNTSASLSWTQGSGDRRMVIMRPHQPVDFQPELLNSHGSSSTNFNATNNYLDEDHRHVYRGNNNNISLTNLEPGVTYHIAIYEYNGPNQSVYGPVSLTGFFTTLPENGIAIGGFDAIMFCPGQTFAVPYFFAGNLNPENQLSVELSDQNGNFSNPVLLGVQTTTNSQGSISASLPLELAQTSGYRLRVLSSDPEEVSADNGADLTIQDAPVPVIAVPGESLQSCGEPILLTASQPGYLIQWFRDGEPVEFATANSLMADRSGSYQVRISGASEGCQTFSEAVELNISEAPDFEFPLDDYYCVEDAAVSLAGTVPSDGIYSGPGVADNEFDPAIANVGQHLLYYTWTEPDTGCEFSTYHTVVVRDLPMIIFQWPFDTISQIDAPIVLNMAEPGGGDYFLNSLDGDPVHTLDPAQLTEGDHVLYYQIGEGNCVGVDSVEFFIAAVEQMVFAPQLDAVCDGYGMLTLPEGTPENGQWSGPFVDENMFDVDLAEPGDYMLYFTAEIQQGYEQSDSTVLTVLARSVTELDVSLCQGESFEFAGITYTESGTFEIVLGAAVNGCDSLALLQVVVSDLPVVSFQWPFDTISQMDAPIVLNMAEPAGGEYFLNSLDGDSVHTLDPAQLGEGDYVLYYQIGEGNCVGVDSVEFYIAAVEQMVFAPQLDAVCDGSGMLTLPEGTPENGKWSGPFVDENMFDVDMAGPGDYMLYFTAEIQQGFEQSDSTVLTVLARSVTELDVSLCQGESFEFAGITYNESGTFEIVLGTAENGCDSLTLLHLHIGPADSPIAQDVTLYLDAGGEAVLNPEQVYNESLSSWTIASLVLDITDFGCDAMGENNVVLTVSDENGNRACESATITVADTLSPVVITQDISIELDEQGQAVITPQDIDNGSYDNCAIDIMELDFDSFGVDNVGENVVTLTVTDFSGNSSSATAVVTVADMASSVELAGSENLQLYPNPAAERINIRSGEIISSMRIADITGRVVYEAETINSHSHQVDVSNFEPGIYMVRMVLQGVVLTRKVQVN